MDGKEHNKVKEQVRRISQRKSYITRGLGKGDGQGGWAALVPLRLTDPVVQNVSRKEREDFEAGG